MNKLKHYYQRPAIKVVDFMVEGGFEASPYRVTQPETEENGLMERMNYDENNTALNWQWDIAQ